MRNPSLVLRRSGTRQRPSGATKALSTLALAATFTAGAVGSFPDDSVHAAERVELATNALADEVVDASTTAVTALTRFENTGDPEALLDYERARTLAARITARQLGYDEFAMIRAWSATSLDHQRAVLTALTQVGVPYQRYASNPGVGFDCSGLTSFAWSAAGVELPRSSGEQINFATSGSLETARAGDLLHYPGHVMIYLGIEDAVVHSVQTGRTVEIDTIAASRVGRVSVGDPT